MKTSTQSLLLTALILSLFIVTEASADSLDALSNRLRDGARNSQLDNQAGYGSAQGSGTASPANCQSQGMYQVQEPRIEITRQNNDAVAQRTLRVQGYIEGVCLTEAGLFQDGRQTRTIPVSTIPNFKRFEFSLTVSPGTNRDIRAYNTQGGRAITQLPDTETEEPTDNMLDSAVPYAPASDLYPPE